ncbi:MAG: ABC transporter permease [Tepidisphaeraceae bacterium]|jgi:lipopolysaccharide transport system permease protein
MQEVEPVESASRPAGRSALTGKEVSVSGIRYKLRRQTGWRAIDFRELWHYRELLWILTVRDIKVRYKQTALGALWAVIQPFFSMIIFTIIFAKFAKMSTDGVQPQVFYFCGLLPWQLFATALTNAGNSLLGNQNLVTKVYFPRLVIPISAVITGLIDFAVAFAVLLVMMAYYHVAVSGAVVFMPVFVFLAFLAALGVGLWLSALNVEYRDVRYVIPFLTQFWLFATPVPYPSSLVPPGWKRTIFGLNPMSGVVEGFRWCMLGKPAPGPMLVVSTLTIVIVLVGGLYYFRRMERTFADLV